MDDATIEPLSCFVEIDARMVTADDEPPSRYVHEYTGSVRLMNENYEPGERIGEWRAAILDIESAVNERQSVFDIFDWSAETIDYYHLLFDDNLDVQPVVSRILYGEDFGTWDPNTLILQRLMIRPEYRGKGYGLQALQALIEELRVGVGIIAMKPFPLQFERPFTDEAKAEAREYGFDQLPANLRTARAKLRRHYAQLGFKLVPKTNYMVMSADATRKLSSWWRESP